jgi:hypothetical protein
MPRRRTGFAWWPVAALCACVWSTAFAAAQTPATWLDRPLSGWNGSTPPRGAAPSAESLEALRARCGLAAAAGAAARQVEALGWVSFDHLDRPLATYGVEVVGGMTGADQACRPAAFHLFVFVDGRFAGTLSPETMITGQDASAGPVRILDPDTITAEFARFANRDMPCCPTSRVSVRYRIERSGGSPLVVPSDVRTTRGA